MNLLVNHTIFFLHIPWISFTRFSHHANAEFVISCVTDDKILTYCLLYYFNRFITVSSTWTMCSIWENHLRFYEIIIGLKLLCWYFIVIVALTWFVGFVYKWIRNNSTIKIDLTLSVLFKLTRIVLPILCYWSWIGTSNWYTTCCRTCIKLCIRLTYSMCFCSCCFQSQSWCCYNIRIIAETIIATTTNTIAPISFQDMVFTTYRFQFKCFYITLIIVTPNCHACYLGTCIAVDHWILVFRSRYHIPMR